MPRSRSINSYPEAFWKVVEQAATTNQIFEFPIASKFEGMQLQGKFYGFRGALLKEAGRLGLILPAEHPQRLKVEAAARQAQEVVCYIDTRELKVRMMHRNQTPEAKLFDEALARAGVRNPQEDLAESARRIAEQATADKPTGGKYG